MEILGQGRAEEKIEIMGGCGVGVVTRPGLDLAVGQPAINPVPRRMIAVAIREAWSQNHGKGSPAVRVTISVPNGLELAGRTLNPRLGIVGGISILGTNGLVKPFSHEAYTATIESGLKVARAAGLSEIVLTTGRRSEKRAMAIRPDLPDTAFIQMADFFCFALEQSAKRGMSRIGLVSFFGKAVKQAQALPCTHAHQAPMDLDRLAGWLARSGADQSLAAEAGRANTARHALEVLRGAGRLDLCPLVGQKALFAMRRFAGPAPELWCVVMDYDHSILYKGSLEPGQKESHA